VISHRPRLPDDVEACVRLLDRVHDLDNYPPLWPVDLAEFVVSEQELSAWVAERDGELIGHVALHDAEGDALFEVATAATGLPASGLAVVARLFASPDVRRVGLGRGLLDLATGEAHARGLRPVLDVAKVLPPAIAMYEAAGWTCVGEVDVRYRDFDPLPVWVYAGPPAPPAD
jgi:GNAT superfamily N-acetyltransferase